MSQVAPFKVTSDDLPDLDRKTREGLEPLLEALNVSFQQVVALGQALPAEEVVSVSLQTQDSVASSFPLTFRTVVAQPRFVSMACTPKDPNHVLTTPFVMQGYSLTDAGLISIPAITGLLPLNGYSLSFFVR